MSKQKQRELTRAELHKKLAERDAQIDRLEGTLADISAQLQYMSERQGFLGFMKPTMREASAKLGRAYSITRGFLSQKVAQAKSLGSEKAESVLLSLRERENPFTVGRLALGASVAAAVTVGSIGNLDVKYSITTAGATGDTEPKAVGVQDEFERPAMPTGVTIQGEGDRIDTAAGLEEAAAAADAEALAAAGANAVRLSQGIPPVEDEYFFNFPPINTDTSNLGKPTVSADQEFQLALAEITAGNTVKGEDTELPIVPVTAPTVNAGQGDDSDKEEPTEEPVSKDVHTTVTVDCDPSDPNFTKLVVVAAFKESVNQYKTQADFIAAHNGGTLFITESNSGQTFERPIAFATGPYTDPTSECQVALKDCGDKVADENLDAEAAVPTPLARPAAPVSLTPTTVNAGYSHSAMELLRRDFKSENTVSCEPDIYSGTFPSTDKQLRDEPYLNPDFATVAAALAAGLTLVPGSDKGSVNDLRWSTSRYYNDNTTKGPRMPKRVELSCKVDLEAGEIIDHIPCAGGVFDLLLDDEYTRRSDLENTMFYGAHAASCVAIGASIGSSSTPSPTAADASPADPVITTVRNGFSG